MSIEVLMIEKFGALFNNRLWWDTTPAGMTAEQRRAPFGVLQEVGGDNRQYVNDKEQPAMLTSRVQLVVWGSKRIEVSAKMREFVSSVHESNSATWIARPIGEKTGDFNEVLDLRGSRQDFMISYPNPNI